MANPDGIAPVAEVKGGPVDFAMVTALKLEREAVLKRLGMANGSSLELLNPGSSSTDRQDHL